MINKRLVQLVPGSKSHIFKAVLSKWICLWCNILIIFYISKLFEKLMNGDIINFEPLTFIILICCLIVRFIFSLLANRESFLASNSVKQILRNKIFAKLLRIGNNYREVSGTSGLIQSAVEGVEQLDSYFGKYLPQLFYSLLAPITLFFVLSSISFKSSLILFIIVPLIPVSIVFVQKIAKRTLGKYWTNYTELGESFLENIQGLTTLKIYSTDKYRHEKMKEEAESFRKMTMRVLIMQLNSITIMDIFAYGGSALGIVVALNELMLGNIELAGCLSIILLSVEFFLPLRLLGSYFHVAMNGIAASKQIFKILDYKEDLTRKKEIENDLTVNLENISFSYKDRAKVIDNISMKFPEKSFTSIVGTSGCGKSTIASIISGVNTINEGTARIGSNNIQDIKQTSISDNICFIGSESYIFAGTLKDNLLMGNNNATTDELWKVLKDMQLQDFFNTKNGLDTKILERGSNLSGGQNQRLALARAILHNSKIYIFDESTNSIDVESETIILNEIKRLSKEKTIILISHRLANCVQSDNIYTLKNGTIDEEGNHEELLKNKGLYYSLWKQQTELESYHMRKQA